jgi:hypothetical protein
MLHDLFVINIIGCGIAVLGVTLCIFVVSQDPRNVAGSK